MSATVAMVLVETETPDNIGAAARAMKNMKLTDLRLVSPPPYWKRKACKMAVNARDVLESAKVFKSLKSAIEDCHTAIGFSRRRGSKRRDYLPFAKTIRLGREKSKRWKKAYVFGKESKGLSNEDTALCDWITTIPANPEYGSLNLAQAVMVTAFCHYQKEDLVDDVMTEDAKITAQNIATMPFLRVTKAEQEDVLIRLKEALHTLEYEEEGSLVIERILGTMGRLMNRAGLLRSEAKMFKGLSRRITEYAAEGPGFKRRLRERKKRA